jgi:hypothetical protein
MWVGRARGEGMHQAAWSARSAVRLVRLGADRDGHDAPCAGPHPRVAHNPHQASRSDQVRVPLELRNQRSDRLEQRVTPVTRIGWQADRDGPPANIRSHHSNSKRTLRIRADRLEHLRAHTELQQPRPTGVPPRPVRHTPHPGHKPRQPPRQFPPLLHPTDTTTDPTPGCPPTMWKHSVAGWLP